ncbi:hypothetical protein FACS1894185_4320 [Betaproteobacteria bacterium]|nr:hypothetical protein FACS1894185_4320 [Betaproteobacteria bacterium]
MHLKRKRILAGVVSCAIICVIAVLTYFAFWSLYFIGFPDGGVTELDEVREWLYRIFIGGNIVFAAWFAVLGFVFYKNNFGKRLMIALCADVIFAFLLWGIHFYFAGFLDDGIGG